MATRLTNMKLREVSFVKRPASPGADVILMKSRGTAAPTSFDDFHNAQDADEAECDCIGEANCECDPDGDSVTKYTADQSRDERGRWVLAGSAAVKALHAIAEHAAAVSRNGLARLKHAVTSTRVTDVRPVAGGGVHIGFKSRTRSGGTLQTYVQLDQEHLPEALHPALGTVQRALQAFGAAPVPRGGKPVTGNYTPAGAKVTKTTTLAGTESMPFLPDKRTPARRAADLAQIKADAQRTLPMAGEKATVYAARVLSGRINANQEEVSAVMAAYSQHANPTTKLDALATEVRKSQPALTREQAFAKACATAEGAALYGEMRGNVTQQPVAKARIDPTTAADRLNSRAAEIRKSNPDLSPAQAAVQAYHDDPEAYAARRG